MRFEKVASGIGLRVLADKSVFDIGGVRWRFVAQQNCWDLVYRFARSKSLTKGTKMYAESVFFSILVLALPVVLVWLAFVSCFVGIAKEKGSTKTGTVWIMGILGSPFLAGLYVAALPDRGMENPAISGSRSQQTISSQLPPI